jgi:hypothetical protein
MKFIALLILAFGIAFSADAQKPKGKKAPVKKGAKTKSKKGSKIKTAGEDELDLFICYEGGPCTFSILKGDTLVYEVNQAGKSYQMYVIPNKFDAATSADYNWVTTAPDGRSGKVGISTAGLKTSNKLITNLTAGDLKLTDATTLWVSEKVFKEITKGKSGIIIDGGAAENFSSPEADASIITISYKNKSVDLDGFLIENKPEGQAGRKAISILNISQNLLVLKIDTDMGSMVLKEVRANKARL